MNKQNEIMNIITKKKILDDEVEKLNALQPQFEDFIGMWDNNVDENICKELIRYYDWNVKHNYNFIPDINGNTIYGMKKALEQEDEAIFINSSSPQYPDTLCAAYWKCLQKCLDEYMKNYKVKCTGGLNSWLFKVHKVKEKQGYHVWHYENGSYEVRDRFLAYMTYLKVPEEGGETEFLHQSKRIDPVVGRTLIWPAGFTHVHRGNPPLKGEKMYLTGWFNMSPPNYESTNGITRGS